MDTVHTRDCEVVVIALENEHEQQFSEEKLIGIALSQDRLSWDYPDEIDPSVGKRDERERIAQVRLQGRALITCPDDCKLRTAPGDKSVKFHFVGDATALVMISDAFSE